MGEPELTAEARHRFEVAGVTEARLTRPRGYPRELRAVLGVLEPDEHVTKVFHVYLRNWLGRSGLLFFTRPRLIYVPRRSFRRRIVSITFESIRHVSVVETPRDLDIKVETSDDRVLASGVAERATKTSCASSAS